MSALQSTFVFFFFNDTATTEIYTLSLHDALPISELSLCNATGRQGHRDNRECTGESQCYSRRAAKRSEEHTSELQSQSNLVCRLLLEKKKKIKKYMSNYDTSIPEHSASDCLSRCT